MKPAPPRQPWHRLIARALEEDIGAGDVTSNATIPADLSASARMVSKSIGISSGIAVAEAVFRQVDSSVSFTARVSDGDKLEPGTVLAEIEGNARSILLAERVALNLIQRLSGIATQTAKYVAATGDCDVRVVDTRKTTPGLRLLEKQAVIHGGGFNHRFGLSDGVLIKDNHLAAIGGPDRIRLAVAAAREVAPHTLRIEIEVASLAELEEALAAGADIIMLDNMTVNDMRKAVRITDGRALLEASGGITLDTIASVAETGVNLISVGALTHSAPALDISLDFAIAN